MKIDFYIGDTVEHQDSWEDDETFIITRLEEYDANDPHDNVWATDKDGQTRYFDESELRVVYEDR